MTDFNSFGPLAALGLVGAALVAIGFNLYRESEQFHSENLEEAKAIRARLKGRFHQRFAAEVGAAIDKAAAGKTSVELVALKEQIAKDSLTSPDGGPEVGVGKLGSMLTECDEVIKAFDGARSSKGTAAGSVILIGVLFILGGLFYILPDSTQAAWGTPSVELLGFVGLLSTWVGGRAYSQYLQWSTKFFKFSEEGLRDL
ncbi:MAG: hypothetical protein WAK40_00820 [Thermoplasmata archaeon]